MPRPWLAALVTFLVAVGSGGVGGPAGAQSLSPRFVPWTGGDTPPLALTDLTGRPTSLADHRGRVVLVNFWATWCEPCRDEIPSMEKLRVRLAGRPFAVLAVNYGESATRVRAFLERMPIDFPVLLDPGQETARAWRVRLLPASFLVGPDGHLRYSVAGELDWASDDVVHAIRALIR